MKITKKPLNWSSSEIVNKYGGYDHYVAVDWSTTTMAIAKINKQGGNKVHVSEHPSDIKILHQLLKQLSGKIIVVLEESSPSHWLYINLYDYAAKVVICDPYKNRLLTDGPKTDPIDAKKLCLLLYSGMIKEVYHGHKHEFEMRRYVSAYIDLVKRGVQLKNQRSGFLSQEGLSKRHTSTKKVTAESTKFIVEQLEKNIQTYEEQKKQYEELFTGMGKKHKLLKNLMTIPGIGPISAMKIAGTVVDIKRFPTIGKYLAYCGLVSHIMISGGRVYGRRRSRYSRVLREAYKTAAITVINGKNPLRSVYEYHLKKGRSEHTARHAVARYIARISFGIMKSGKPYKQKPEKTV